MERRTNFREKEVNGCIAMGCFGPGNKCVCARSVTSVVSDSLRPWTVAARILCPWDYPSKNTGVDCQATL